MSSLLAYTCLFGKMRSAFVTVADDDDDDDDENPNLQPKKSSDSIHGSPPCSQINPRCVHLPFAGIISTGDQKRYSPKAMPRVSNC